MTLFEKIWNEHTVLSISEDTVVLYIDRHYLHEVTSPQAFEGLRQRGVPVFRPEQCTATVDHNVPTKNQHLPIEDPVSRKQVQTLLENCGEHRIECFDIGHENQGIVHVIGPELGKTLPGNTIVCGDSHTSTHGAFACIAFGIGTSQVEQVLATQCLVMKRPKTMKIEISGKLHPFVTPKDVILFIIAVLGAEGANEHFVEYSGNVIREMSMEGRMTVCNMSIEMGARGGLIAVDDVTIDYLKERIPVDEETIQKWRVYHSEVDAQFDKVVNISAEAIFPMATAGTSPDTAIRPHQPIGSARKISDKALEYMGFDRMKQLSSQKVDFVFIGSCTNGRMEDLGAAASLIKGKKKADHVTVWVVPGSQSVKKQAIAEGLDAIFSNAGFEFRDPGCSACLAMNDDKIPAGAVCVSTSNRNFEGRQGAGAKTILASPITAAVSAITGKITDPTSFINYQ